MSSVTVALCFHLVCILTRFVSIKVDESDKKGVTVLYGPSAHPPIHNHSLMICFRQDRRKTFRSSTLPTLQTLRNPLRNPRWTKWTACSLMEILMPPCFKEIETQLLVHEYDFVWSKLNGSDITWLKCFSRKPFGNYVGRQVYGSINWNLHDLYDLAQNMWGRVWD